MANMHTALIEVSPLKCSRCKVCQQLYITTLLLMVVVLYIPISIVCTSIISECTVVLFVCKQQQRVNCSNIC